MKYLMVAVLAVMSVFATKADAQMRVTLGSQGGIVFDNQSLGVQLGFEVPFAHRYELDVQDTFSPLESHVALGHGRANIIQANGRVWMSEHWGVFGGAEDSMYDVTKVTKDADYAFGGVTWRGIFVEAPTRFSLSYIREFNNGITSGLETPHLQGADFGFDARLGCFAGDKICVRHFQDYIVGHVLTQSNPVCDGTYGITGGPGGGPCYRQGAFGGGVKLGVKFEIGGAKDKSQPF